MIAQLYYDARAVLGEGPVWDERTDELHWVDIDRGEIHRRAADTGAHHVVTLDEAVGSAVPTAAGDGWIVGTRSGVARVALDGLVTRRVDVDHARVRHRMNDGACDARGRFWTGTLNEDDAAPCDALYRVDVDWTVTRVQSDIGLSNGLGWSADDRVMFRVDSKRRLVYAAAFDAETGTRHDERVFVDLSDGEPEPDGLAVDRDGCVWVALWDGWCVNRYGPDGALVDVVEVPVARPTSVAFGRDGLATLFITTASKGVDQPHAGAIFCVETDTAGVASGRFGG